MLNNVKLLEFLLNEVDHFVSSAFSMIPAHEFFRNNSLPFDLLLDEIAANATSRQLLSKFVLALTL